MRRLALFFDGTWNTIKSDTNVSNLCFRVPMQDGDGVRQITFYDPGVGTRWYDKYLGGALGLGLSKNIRQGYYWLAKRYREGDEVYLFGFSRGAYTARSFAGLIRKCGLLRVADHGLTRQAYDLYRRRDVTPDTPEALEFRRRMSREIRIRFIGVWDTVGSLGIPVTGVPFGRDYYRFHDEELSGIVDYAYHGVALDEHREDYQATLWKKIKPNNREVEQRWFVGAHANVGGGYKNDVLQHLPLQWIESKAVQCGLTVSPAAFVSDRDYLAPVNDSFKEFMFGLYRLLKHKQPYIRSVGLTVAEQVDLSVCSRIQDDPGYSPPQLAGDPSVCAPPPGSPALAEETGTGGPAIAGQL